MAGINLSRTHLFPIAPADPPAKVRHEFVSWIASHEAELGLAPGLTTSDLSIEPADNFVVNQELLRVYRFKQSYPISFVTLPASESSEETPLPFSMLEIPVVGEGALLTIEADPTEIVIEGLGDQPTLRLAELKGHHAFFVLVGAHSAKSKEGEEINRALNRWIYPEGTTGYIIGDAEGFGLLRDKITKIMGNFAEEVRFPLYVDFEGVFMQTFKLPKGHHALVVLGPDGEPLFRHSGGVEGAGIDEVRELLGAQEPPPGPEPPAFSLGPLDHERCAQRTCAIAFLGEPVEQADVPGIEGGFAGDDDEGFERMRNPSVRIVRTLLPTRLEEADGVIVGSTLHRDGVVGSGIDRARVEAFVRAAGG